MRSPWKAGNISRRCSMCASPSSRITEVEPTTGSSTRAPRPGASTSGGAVKIFFTSSGRVSITNGGEAGSLIVKRGPYRSRQCSINARGRVQYPTAWISGGYLGPGGSFAGAATTNSLPNLLRSEPASV